MPRPSARGGIAPPLWDGGSLAAAVFGIVKGTVGPAILYLPRGFRQAGWAAAVLCLGLSTSTYLYSAGRLLECWRAEREREEREAGELGGGRGLGKKDEVRALRGEEAGRGAGASPRGRYGSLEEGRRHHPATASAPGTGRIPLTYPELARRSLGPYSLLVTGGIAAMQFGVCLTYLIFVPQTLGACARAMASAAAMPPPPFWAFLAAMVAAEVPLAWIRDIRRLAPTNVLATLLIAYGLAACLAVAGTSGRGHAAADVGRADGGGSPGNAASPLLGRVLDLPALGDAWYLFVGTSFFVFEGSITLLVPLQEAVREKRDRDAFPRLNVRVQHCIVTFYVIFALACWAALGDGVQTALTASLPPGPLSASVQIAYSIAVVLTFPLQAFPALEVACRAAATVRRRNAAASAIVCGLGVVAYLAIDDLGNVVSLLGSLVGIPIALVYPNLMHNVMCASTASARVRAMNYAVASIGLFATFAASYTTIMQWDRGTE